jgi:hypothetical protein
VLAPNGVSLNRNESQLVICAGFSSTSWLNMNVPAGMGTISSLNTSTYKLTGA